MTGQRCFPTEKHFVGFIAFFPWNQGVVYSKQRVRGGPSQQTKAVRRQGATCREVVLPRKIVALSQQFWFDHNSVEMHNETIVLMWPSSIEITNFSGVVGLSQSRKPARICCAAPTAIINMLTKTR